MKNDEYITKNDKYITKNEKYITFKRADYDAVLIRNNNDMPVELKHVLLQSEVRDAVVIRLHDVFAGPALHSYAANIALAARLLPPAEAAGLLDIADYFHECAVEADELAHSDHAKLPD